MMENITKEDIRKILAQVMHPVIKCNLVDLGIIKDISIDGDIATITMAFPFVGIPAKDISIRDQIVNSLRESIKKLGVKVELKQTEMNDEEFKAFLEIERKTWKNMDLEKN